MLKVAIFFSIWLIHCKNSKFTLHNKTILIISFCIIVKQCFLLKVGLRSTTGCLAITVISFLF